MFELDVVTDDSLARFLQRWYGPPDRPVSTRPLPPALPAELVEWYRLADRWSLPLSRDHIFKDPDAGGHNSGEPVASAGPGGHNSGETVASAGPGGHNSGEPVATQPHGGGGANLVEFWHADDGSDSYAYGDDLSVFEDGRPTGIPLRRFLVYVAVFEAVYAPIHGLIHLDVKPDVHDAIVGRLLPLQDPLWQWPDPALRYYADDDLLVHAGAGRLVIAARHRDALGRFDGHGIDWAWDSRRSG